MTIYDEIADMFMASLAGQISGVSREEFIMRVKTKYPSEDEARAFFEAALSRGRAFAEQAERDAIARGVRIIGIGYQVGEGKK